MSGSESTTKSNTGRSLTTAELDRVLTAQLVVAWAGESGEEPRLGWWRSDLTSEFGGEDLFRRLLPNSWAWATLQAVREAARRKDADLRSRFAQPDGLSSLFAVGFELDERLDERFADLKRGGRPPREALPGLAEVVAPSWDASAFTRWVEAMGRAKFETEPHGRRVSIDAEKASVVELVLELVGALSPVSPSYPLPYVPRPR